MKNVVTTTNLIDMDIYIDDVDHSCLKMLVTVRLIDSYEKEYLPKIEPTNIKRKYKNSDKSVDKNNIYRTTRK